MKRQRKPKQPDQATPNREPHPRGRKQADDGEQAHPAQSRRAQAEALNERLKSLFGLVNQTELYTMEALRFYPHLADELGLTPGKAREYIRVATAFVDLPRIRSLFAEGKMSWDQVRAVTRVATADTEAQWIDFAADEPVDVLLKKVAEAVRDERTSP